MNRLSIIAAFFALLFLAGQNAFAQSGYDLFQKGLVKERTEGDLDEAIRLYKQIVAEHKDDRALAAKALIQMGRCYEKLGQTEAQKAYQRVIEEYPGQKQEVAIAKERITELSKVLKEVAHKPNFRKIQIPTTPGNGVLSPDGKKLAFVSEGSIWVVPVHGKVSHDIAGEPVRLPGTEGAWHWGMSWSANGKWIAYNNLKNDEICIIPSLGGKMKRISVQKRDGMWNYRLSLSPDGKIVAFAATEKEKIQLYTVNVDGGDANQLTEDGGTEPAFSPNGKKIAYVNEKPHKTGTSHSVRHNDVWVIPTEGGTPVQVSDLPGRAIGPIWSPDGKMIAFTRNAGRDHSNEIYIVPVSETGKPEAPPKQIELPLATWNFLAGWTPDNNIGALLTEPRHQAIYTVPAIGGKATQVTPHGNTFHPRWSPDGERIYFRWNRGDIASVPSGGGEISICPFDADSKICDYEALPGGGNAVSPDGKKIVFSGAKRVFKDNKRDWEVDIYTIPIEGGEPKKLTTSPGQDRFPCWSPDGKKIAFIRYGSVEPWKEMSICIVSTEGGEVRQLTSESHRVLWSTISWSPDGKSIAYFSYDKAIKVIPVQGGEYSEVVKVEDVSGHSELAWSPDGKKLVYSSKGSIWMVSLDGGEPEEIRTGLDAKAGHVSWSPDGGKIAFTATKGGDAELWIMENFLPEIEPKVKTVRQVWSGSDVDIEGAPSPDGKYLSYVDWDTGDLAVYEIATGNKRRLTNKGSWDKSDEFAQTSRWSPDGKKIVYEWYNKKDFIDLCIVGLDGSKPRILYSNEEVWWAETYGWSPDGREVLACLSNKHGDQIVLVSAADGSVRVLKTLNKYHPQNISFSPDGRYIVHDFPQKEDSPESDISLLLRDGSREIPLIEHPADDRVLGWSPDGKHILITSDRTGTKGAWLIEIEDGEPQGDPELVKQDIGQRFMPMGFTKEGSFYYGSGAVGVSDVYIAKLDPESGKVLIPPKKAIQRFEGHNLTPDYSPDGKYLAYTSNRGRRKFICIRTVETGQEREFRSKFRSILEPRWSPDGSSILVGGMDYKGNRLGIYRVNIKTGIFTLVLPPPEGIRFSTYEWSTDGKSFFLGLTSGKDKVSQIMLREIESGTEKEIYRTSDLGRFRLSCSPDGKWLAFISYAKKGALRIIPTVGGEPQELYMSEQENEQLVTLRWTSDGKYIFLVIRQPEQKNFSLLRIPKDGGEPQKLGLEMNIMSLSVHSDGQHIAFNALTRAPAEVWVMENFLPKAKTSK